MLYLSQEGFGFRPVWKDAFIDFKALTFKHGETTDTISPYRKLERH
jgi:hypothetical protein